MEDQILMAIPIAPLLIGGASLLGSIFSGGSKSSTEKDAAANLKKFRGQLFTGIGEERREARSSRQAQREFDPHTSARESSMATFKLLQPEFRRQMEDLIGGAVGGGRLQTGFVLGDAREQERRQINQMGNIIKTGSLQAEGLNLRNIEGRAGSQDRYLDALLGGMDIEQARENAAKQSRSSMSGTLGNIAGMAFGSAFG